MKRVLSCFIVTCISLIYFCNITFAATYSPTIIVENGAVGNRVTVSVSIPQNTNAAGGSFNLVYDNTKMKLVDATAGDLISAFSKTVNKSYAVNKIRLNFAGSETVAENGGVVLTAVFELTAPGTAIVSTEKFKLADINTNYLTCADVQQNMIITNNNEDVFTPEITVQNGTVGDIVAVTVSIPENTKAAGGSFNLVYDNSKLELIDATAGDIISAFSKTVNKTYAVNKVRLNFAGSETVSASGGVILSATFKFIAEGTATLSIEKFKLADLDANYLTCSDSSKSIIISEKIEIPEEGLIDCGTDANGIDWYFYESGLLKICGTEAMEDYSKTSAIPWYGERQNILEIVIDDGITHIGNRSFYNCVVATKVTIPPSVETIGTYAFRNCAEVTIYGESGSYAETYANANSIPFVNTKPVEMKTATVDYVEGTSAWYFDVEVVDYTDEAVVYAAAYDQSGRMLNAASEEFMPDDITTVTLNKTANTAYVKVFVVAEGLLFVTYAETIEM